MNNHEILVRFGEAIAMAVEQRKTDFENIEWSLREMLSRIEHGRVTRIEAAQIADLLDKREFHEADLAALRVEVREAAMALVECGEA